MSLGRSLFFGLATCLKVCERTAMELYKFFLTKLVMLFLDPPSFLKVPKPVEGIKGKDVSFSCELYGTAPFEIIWFKDKRVVKESRKYKMVNESSSASLLVLGLDGSDGGQYECRATNNVGSETCQTAITLRG